MGISTNLALWLPPQSCAGRSGEGETGTGATSWTAQEDAAWPQGTRMLGDRRSVLRSGYQHVGCGRADARQSSIRGAERPRSKPRLPRAQFSTP